MLIYRDAVSAWNAVDVIVDGRLQHGKVISLAEGGLIIDFECVTQRSQFVQYGRIFCCLSKYSWKGTVQVLLRCHPDSPWIWYSGRVVPLGLQSYTDVEYVEVQLPYGTARELVSYDQVRLAPTYEELRGRRVGPGDFVIRGCPLPTTFWADGTPLLREIFQCEMSQRHQVLCTTLLIHTLHYLQCQTAAPLTAEHVDVTYTSSRAKLESGWLSGPSRLLLRQKMVIACRTQLTAADSEADGTDVSLALPAELLVEIFQALDSIGRVRCRRVCAVWNTLLTTLAYFPDVRVSGRHGEYDEQSNTMHWLLACLLKCPSRVTQIVALIQVDWYGCGADLSALINGVRSTSNLVSTLVLYKVDFGGTVDCIARMTGLMADLVLEFSSTYRKILWKRCRMWDLFESSLLLRKPLDRPALTAWIADCVAHKPIRYIENNIFQELYSYQSVDPRRSTHYHRRKWRLSNVGDLDVNKLTTITTAALSEKIHPTPWELT
ncbi:uncharacterized protein LOC129594418 isoform X2 [Paramacrobiotus metropolitanus]|uniref:uncharacterized protein LOC129594418 isoform X2 n=1 Tax=Paramacrobiotus metropolitanus TaxID=2943436 RepID=UPI002445C194|nr:uncharacterized protein LOC129594418 isoform X2 [Paramacrobiotus metropolitanus]